MDSAIAGTVDEILAPELRRYEAARSVLDERIEEDRRRAAEAEAERRAEEIRQRVDAEIERELREAAEQRRRAETAELRQVVHDLDTITPNGRGGYRFAFVRGLDQQEKERREAILYADKEKTKEVLKEELQERQLQAKREQDRDLGYDMEP